MINPKFFIGYAENFKDICFVYPPKVKDMISDNNASLLTISHEDIEDKYVEQNIDDIPPSPFIYILSSAYSNKELENEIKKAFYFFIHENVYFLYEQKMILVGGFDEAKKIKSVEDLRIIKEEDFLDFQNLIRESIGEEPKEAPDPNMNPKIKKMKAKARYRDRVKAKQNGLSLGSMLASICCMGIGLTPLNIGEISYACVPALIRYYQEKDKYETDIASLLAGAKVKPEFWVRNIKDDK